MSKRIKSRLWLITERVGIIVAVIVITTVIVRAIDNRQSETIVSESNESCPDDMVYVTSPSGGYCLDIYEASPSEDCPYINPRNQSETRSNIDQRDCQAVSIKGGTPWRFVSQNQAALVCAKAGKRLPTNKEWLQAALGTPDAIQGWTQDDCQVGKNWDAQPGPTGGGQYCVSAAGVHDMIGNVWEWVDGTVNNGKYQDFELPEAGYIMGVNEHAMPTETNLNEGDENYYNDYFWLKNKGTRAIARGGYWDNEEQAGQYSLYIVSPTSFAGTGIGFRCAK